jgi:hypothetical protein
VKNVKKKEKEKNNFEINNKRDNYFSFIIYFFIKNESRYKVMSKKYIFVMGANISGLGKS